MASLGVFVITTLLKAGADLGLAMGGGVRPSRLRGEGYGEREAQTYR
jgi:hypothetical protein